MNIPNINVVQSQAAAFLPDSVRPTWNPLYDYQDLLSTNTKAQFFQLPKGQTGLNLGRAKDLRETNMQAPGSLPTGQSFLVDSIQIELIGLDIITTDPQEAVANTLAYKNFMDSGVVKFQVGSVDFVEQHPINKFPPRNYFEGYAANGVGAITLEDMDVDLKKKVAALEEAKADTSIIEETIAMHGGKVGAANEGCFTNYLRNSGHMFHINPIYLQPNVNFDVTLDFMDLSFLSGQETARVGVTLNGVMYRNAQ